MNWLANFLNWLDTRWVMFQDMILDKIVEELYVIYRNVKTAPKETPVAFWLGLLIVIFLLIRKR